MENKLKRVTITSVVTKILLGRNVPPDRDIIAAVHEQTGRTTFKQTDLYWYKTKARQGKLKGQKKQLYVIRQMHAKIYDAPAPPMRRMRQKSKYVRKTKCPE